MTGPKPQPKLVVNKTYIQPLSGFFEANVPPLTDSHLKLPEGKYSLGVDSTVPFISLQGGGSAQKIFTWGEMIEVRSGQTVTVKNESFMRGDIQINSGWDYSAQPERISLPVQLNTTVDGIITTMAPVFPADTRRCRRAYVKCDILTQLAQINIIVTGKPQKHSFPAIDSNTGLAVYTEVYSIAPVTAVHEFPLGYGEPSANALPMALTDQATFSMGFNNTVPANLPIINTLFMYVLEY